MKLSIATKLFKLIDVYPFLLEYMVGYNPKFRSLKNPVMRKTFGRIATIEMISDMGGIPSDKLLEDIRQKIETETGDALEIVSTSDPIQKKARMEMMKEIIRDLHAGKDVSEIKARFDEMIQDVSPSEIAQMEQQLISEGLPANEIAPMCDLHAQVFSKSLDNQDALPVPPGHPVHTFLAENRAIKDVIAAIQSKLGELDRQNFVEQNQELTSLFGKLSEVRKHYLRKENQLFPFLEKYGVNGPPQVMWTIHDNVRALLKQTRSAIESQDLGTLTKKGQELFRLIDEMIYKEEKILFPMALDMLNEDDWATIRRGESEIGYALITPAEEGKEESAATSPVVSAQDDSLLPLDTGYLSLEQVNLVLKHLPVEISFIDENDEVRYYTNIPNKIFPRSPEVIGRKVQNCHPPKSLHLVNRILAAFRDGSKNVASFWIQMNGKFIYIRYFAVRDSEGNYRGSLEVVQDVAEIRELDGERRLLDWK